MRVAVRALIVWLALWPIYSVAVGPAAVGVYVAVEPIRFLVEQVGGPYVDVAVLVGAGRSPETYEPTPRQIAALARADIFFGVGMPLETVCRQRLAASPTLPEWVDLGADVRVMQLATGQASDTGTHRDPGEIDPHVWLSPLNARHMALEIADVLTRLDPAHGQAFAARAAALSRELESLHAQIADILGQSAVTTFLVYHPAWGYFARTYGLTQLAIAAGDKEPGTRRLVRIIDEARKLGLRTVFVDPAHGGHRLARAVATALDGRIRELHPLAYDYLDNLRRTALAIAASQP